MQVRWKPLQKGDFFDIDYPRRTVWLIARTETNFCGSKGSLNDAPVLKALVYLLTRNVFEGEYLGSRDRDNIILWRTVLQAAIKDEMA